MSKHKKYTPKHRHVVERTPLVAPKKVLRSTVLFSSVAVAATGVAVSGGVLSAPGSISSAAEDLGKTVSAPLSTPQADVEREPTTSRSFDRRAAADPVKKAALSVAGAASARQAVTKTVDLADGDPRSIAQALLPEFGFSSDQFGCLDSLWTRESNWNPAASNASSGAFGIPQSLPGSKMASAGADWATNPATQIKWGLGYIQDRYGSPCGAWSHSESYGWY
ncbi:lytic transglycosylase domain-containing protein [Nocardioides sp. CN2-186]|uniref:aggregation-promoting factor C-terminal-like domain-containing protein n=1 Tax=Nocardioides tweenelious TaxID=3156607 RepID=UPI0032B54985